MIEIHVPAVPIAQPRPRAAMGQGGHARVHNVTSIKQADGTSKPHPIAAFKAAVMLAAREVYHGPPLDGPLRCDLVFVMPRPRSKVWKMKPMPRYPHTIKPDADNLLKSLLDSLNQVLWVDDAQICEVSVRKVVASGYEQPHVTIKIQEICNA